MRLRCRRRKKYPQNCHYCHKPCGRDYTWDHIVPTSLGGPNKFENVVPACDSCNNKKSNKISSCECKKCIKAIYNWKMLTLPNRDIPPVDNP